MVTMLSQEEFTQELERVLQHLYDPVYLRGSELMRVLLEEGRRAPTAMQDVIIQAIQALRPDPAVPPRARAWCMYQVLTMRYAEQLSQEDVAGALAYSSRHIRRQEIAAIQTLADYLWQRYDLGERLAEDVTEAEIEAVDGQAPLRARAGITPASDQELFRLAEAVPAVTVDIQEMVGQSLDVVRPLAEAGRVRVDVQAGALPSTVTGQAAALRQGMIGLLTAGVAAAEGGELRVTVSDRSGQAVVTVVARPAVALRPYTVAEIAEHLRVAEELIRAFGGRLEVAPTDRPGLEARLCIHCPDSALVLAIDDNADALRLYERFLDGSRFHAVTTTDPEEGLDLAVSLGVRAIVLDIMIPNVDGWELLGRLRNHPSLDDVPLIVCSILPHERLATTLGADRFLRKPIRRDLLLSALEELVLAQPTESRSEPRST